ncbi:MAG TPA: LptA/OstA family protein [Verrucomicrobiae bacterium]|nr:LptA/OstA family protein [Verrucomicrobiae bacterium]
MKIVYIIAIALLGGFNLRAQMDLNGGTTNSVRPPTRIDSDRADFDMNARKAFYHGHVVVNDPQMKLTCDELVADIPQSGHIQQIVAETNVVIDFIADGDQTNHVTAEKAVYNFKIENGVTNETVTLTGNPVVRNAQGEQSGDVITWDRANGRFSFVHPHMVFSQHLNFMPETNSSLPTIPEKPKAITNKPAATNAIKPSPPRK